MVTSGRGAHRDEIEAIYRGRFGAFVRSTSALLGNGEEALDVVQEGFAKALRKRRSFRRDGSLEGWIWRIVLNIARDRLRGTPKHPAGDRERQLLGETAPGHDHVRDLVRALPERQRLAVFLRYFADLSYDDIAAVLDVQPGTVAASLNAAHRTLRRDLEEVVR